MVATATLVGTTISLNLPLLSLVLARAGWDSGAIGLNATAASLGIFPLIPLLPRLLRVLGARGCIALGATVAAAGMPLLPLSLDFAWWYTVRLVVGTGTALVFVASEAAINALVPDAVRGRVIALYATVFCLGYVAGPLVVAAAGVEGWLPFLLSAGLYLAGALPALFARALDGVLREGPALAGPAVWFGLLRRGAGTFWTIFVFGLVETAVFALWPVHARTAGGDGEGWAAATVALWIAGNFALQMPVGWLADRLDRRRLTAAVATLAALVFLALTPLPPTAPAALALLFAAGGLVGSLYSLALVRIGSRFRGLELALANTAFVATIQLGAVIGPGLAGPVMATLGSAALAPLLALLLATVVPAARGRRA